MHAVSVYIYSSILTFRVFECCWYWWYIFLLPFQERIQMSIGGISYILQMYSHLVCKRLWHFVAHLCVAHMLNQCDSPYILHHQSYYMNIIPLLNSFQCYTKTIWPIILHIELDRTTTIYLCIKSHPIFSPISTMGNDLSPAMDCRWFNELRKITTVNLFIPIRSTGFFRV